MKSIAIAIGLVGIVFASGRATAQTVEEQTQILRDFQQNVADYAKRYQCWDPGHAAATSPAQRIFTLPAAMLFRQVIAKALEGRARLAFIGGVGDALRRQPRWTVLEPFPTDALHHFPPVLKDALPPLPAPLEYRLIGDDLVLRDREANLVVAVLREAVSHDAVLVKQ